MRRNFLRFLATFAAAVGLSDKANVSAPELKNFNTAPPPSMAAPFHFTTKVLNQRQKRKLIRQQPHGKKF